MAKRIIVCLDGTWKEPETADGESHSSNVLKFMRALKTSGADGLAQVVYYDRGVGSDNLLDKYLGGAFGFGLSRNVLEAYRWVANNYAPGDRLYFVGFSRGAYSVRSLAGLIGAVGLMSKLEVGALPEAYDYYRVKPAERHSHGYHVTAARRAKPAITMVGVWDTVGSLGIPISSFASFNKRYAFHDVRLGAGIENAFQALAIDEFRKPFEPAIWEKPDGWTGRLEQVWFAGAHSNVGGGYADCRLSDIALDWMVDRGRACGLDFDPDYLDCFLHKPPRHLGALGDEYGGLYRLYGRHLRPVERDPARGLDIHASVLERAAEASLDYRPANIRGLDDLLRGRQPGS